MPEKNTTINPFEKNNTRAKKSKKGFLKIMWKQRYLQIMVLLGILWMIIFNYIPMGGIIIAFKNYTITKPILEAPWAANYGLQHFIDFFTDENFRIVLTNTLGISLLKLFVSFPLPILFALLLNELKHMRFKKAVQTISYLPHFISWVVLGGMMINWLDASGLINELLLGIGLLKEPIYFLGEPRFFWGLAVGSDIWKELGWGAIIYLASIAGIDQEIYEAAKIDGANRFQQMYDITIPSIKGTIAIMFILAVSGILNSNFDQILVLWNPLNNSKSTVVDIFVYRMAMSSGRFSYATAVGLLKSVVALFLLVIANKTTKKINDVGLY